MPVDFLSEREWLKPVALVGDNRSCSAPAKESPQRRDVIGFIRQKSLRRRQFADEGLRDDAIVDIPARQQKSYRPAFAVRERVDFARAAAPADAERLAPFLPCAAR